MRENVKKQIRNAKKRRIRRRRFYAAVALCSILVAGIVSWKLILPGTAMSGETYCGKEEHTHSDACYEQVLVCGQEEGAGAHTHTDACYTEVRTDQLICGQEESAGHVHTDACYTNELTCGQEESAEHTHTDACYTKTLTCGQEEGAGAHTHTDACYATERKLTCGQEEGAGHTHTDACYKTELTCGKEEHKHTSECYSNPDAVETEDQWKAAFKNYKLTGEWGKDTAAVAKSQVGYKESTENYKVNEDKSTDGYTRYADWAGDDIYGDWNTDFAAFCLNYAGVPSDKFPVNTDDLGAWITAMNNAGYYGDPDSSDPQPGDLIVLKKADQDNKQTVGIVSEVKTDKDGNVTTVKTIEGDCDDAVKENKYDADSSEIAGYGLVNEAYEDTVGSREGENPDKIDENGTDESTSRSIALKKSAPMRAANDETIDFSDMISSVTLQHKQSWESDWTDVTDDTSVDVNDQLRFTINYTVPENGLGGNSAITYQLPDDITILQKESGKVINDSGQEIGDYEIGTNGTISITFYGDFVAGNTTSPINGHISFESSVNNIKGADDGKVDLEFNDKTSVTITIIDQNDLKVQKESSNVNQEEGTVDYKITVTSTDGTSEKVTLKDIMTNIGLDGTINDIKVVTGTGEEVEFTAEHTEAGFTLDLPSMNANDTYIITYTGKLPDGMTAEEIETNNSVTVTSKDDNNNDLTSTATVNVTFTKQHLKKTGDKNEDGTITWTITVNGSHEDIAGWTLSDEFNGVSLGDDVKLTIASIDGVPQTGGSTEIRLPYKFEPDSGSDTNKHSYVFTYTTSNEIAPGNWQTQNKAKLDPPSGEAEEGYDTGNVSVGGDGSQYNPVQKGSGNVSVDEDEKTVTINWTLTVDTSKGPIKEGWPLEDIADDEWGSRDHYFTAEQVEAYENSLREAMDTAGLNDISFTLEKELYPEIEGAYRMITVKFSEDIPEGKYFSFAYQTTGILKNPDEEQNFTNTVKIYNESVDVTGQYKPVIQKYDSNNEYYPVYSDTTNHSSAELRDGKLHWGISINLPSDYDGGDVTVTETLPEDVTLSGLTIKGGNSDAKDIKDEGVHSVVFGDQTGNITTAIKDNVVTITIPERLAKSAGLGEVIIDVTVDLPVDWSVPDGETSVAYENSVKITSETSDLNQEDTQTQVITPPQQSESSLISKSHLTVENNIIPYEIEINKEGADLLENTDTLTLTDVISIHRPTGIGVSLVPNSVKVYEVDASGGKRALDNSLYDYTYTVTQNPNMADNDDHTLTFTIPDSKHLIVEYKYKATGAVGTEYYGLNNTATLTGVSSGNNKDNESLNIKITESSAGANLEGVQIYKVDAESYDITLSGAEFILYQYNGNNYVPVKYDPDKETYTSVSKESEATVTTGENGSIGLRNLVPNTAYRLKEITAPQGYIIQNEYTDFYIYSSDTEKYPNCLPNDFSGMPYVKGDNIYIPNKSNTTEITVEKKWQDSDGNNTTDEHKSGSVTLYLYQTTKAGSGGGNSGTANVEISVTKQGWNSNPACSQEQQFQCAVGTELTICVNTWGTPVISANGQTLQYNNQSDEGNGLKTFTYHYTITGDVTISGCAYNDTNGCVTYSCKEPPSPDTGDTGGEETTTTELEPYRTVTLNATEDSTTNWKYTFTDLPLTGKDEDGNPVTYYYFVEEEPVTNYTPSYKNNDGIQRGTITVTNKEDENPSYELPETGGIGTKVYIAGGTILMMSSCLLGGYRMRRKRERRRR